MLLGIDARAATWYNYQFFSGFTLNPPVLRDITKTPLDKFSGEGYTGTN